MSMLRNFRAEKARLSRALIVVGVISFLSSLCLLVMPLYLSQIYSRVIFSHSIETLVSLTVLAVVVLATYAYLDAVRSNILGRLAAEFEARMSGPILAAELLRANDTQRNTLSFLTVIARTIDSKTFPAFFDLPGSIFFLILVMFIHPVLGGVVLAGIVLLTGLAVIGELSTARFARDAQESSNAARKQLDAAYRQQEIVKAMGMFREVVSTWAVDQSRNVRDTLAAGERTNVLGAISRTLRQLIQIAMIGTGALLVMQGHIVAGTIFATSIMAGRALQPIEAIVSGWRNLKSASLSMKMLEARLAKLELPDSLTPLPRPKGKIGVEQVFYNSPSGGEPLLKGVTGQVPAGGAMAIIGPSGAGKSTLARCIVGYLSPSRGRVTLDGQDIESWDPIVKGLYMGYLPQTVEFFEGTIAQNIARLRQGDPAEFVIQAAKFAGVHDMIMSFPQGYDTMISAQAFQPSGGQRQLLGLARAFYGNPAVVVLDEPNANLDGDGEKILNQAIVRSKQNGTTVIVVTQRLALLQFVDKVLVMKNGQVDQMAEPADIQKNNVRSINKPVARAASGVAGSGDL